MSELGKFVAAAIRDKVVMEQQIEIDRLERENKRLRSRVAHLSRTVAVTGPNGTPVYAQGELDVDGEQIGGDNDVPRWYVTLTPNPHATCASIQQLQGLEIRIGDRGRKLMDNDEGFGYFMDYDMATERVDITWCGRPILHGSFGPISADVLENVREQDEFQFRDIDQIFQDAFEHEEEWYPVTFEFEAVKFNNDQHTLWNVESPRNADE